MILLMMRCHKDTVMLRNTAGPYGRLVIKVAYGEMILSLHRGCMRDNSLGRVVGVSAWCIAHVWHTRVNTSVGSVYIYIYIYFWFSTHQNPCICIMFLKSICNIKQHWWSLVLSWPDEVQRKISTAHELLKVKIDTTDKYMFFLYIYFIITSYDILF